MHILTKYTLIILRVKVIVFEIIFPARRIEF